MERLVNEEQFLTGRAAGLSNGVNKGIRKGGNATQG
jgi:hypothetical protein